MRGVFQGLRRIAIAPVGVLVEPAKALVVEFFRRAVKDNFATALTDNPVAEFTGQIHLVQAADDGSIKLPGCVFQQGENIP